MLDSLQTIIALQESSIDDYKATIKEKNGQIEDCNDSRNRLNMVITNYQALQAQDKASYTDLEKLYKKQVRVGRFHFLIIGALAGAVLYQTFK